MTRTHKKPALRSTSEPFFIPRGGSSRPALLNNNRHTFPLPTLLFGPGFLSSLALLLWPSLGTLPTTTTTTTTVHTAAVCPPLSLLCTCLLFFLFLVSFLSYLPCPRVIHKVLSYVRVCAQRSVRCHIYNVIPCTPIFPTQPDSTINMLTKWCEGLNYFKGHPRDKSRGEHARPVPIFYGSHTAGLELLRTNA